MPPDPLPPLSSENGPPLPPEGFAIGPVFVARDGRLAPQDPAAPPALRFAWRGRDCVAEIGAETLRVTARPARVPYTIEHRAGREAVLGLVATLPEALPPGWRVSLTPEHHLRLEAARAGAATAVTVVAEMVRFALALDPLLDRLEAAGAR